MSHQPLSLASPSPDSTTSHPSAFHASHLHMPDAHPHQSTPSLHPISPPPSAFDLPSHIPTMRVQHTMRGRNFQRSMHILPFAKRPSSIPSQSPDSDPEPKKRLRLSPTAVVLAIALAFFGFGVLTADNVSSVLTGSSTMSVSLLSVVRPLRAYHRGVVASSSRLDQVRPSSKWMSSSDSVRLSHNVETTMSKDSTDIVAPVQGNVSNVSMAWVNQDAMNDSLTWPRSQGNDPHRLLGLAAYLKLSNATLLNYFHMHKTGGVTTKTQLIKVLDEAGNFGKEKHRGGPLRYLDTCYQTKKLRVGVNESASDEGYWRCDFGRIKTLPWQRIMDTDWVMGHQYWMNGCDMVYDGKRDVRYVSIFRHPLPRKLSFFYHFFIRNVGRDEMSVSREEVLRFVLAKDLPNDPRCRDSGPNYYASRFLSDGTYGFVENQFVVNDEDVDTMIMNATKKIDKQYALVGLQEQGAASQCMLRKLMVVFAHAQGIDDLVGTERLTRSERRLNSGGYPWSGRSLWESMSTEQRERFKMVERVDLEIYEKVRRRFLQDLSKFGCESKLDRERWADDVYE